MNPILLSLLADLVRNVATNVLASGGKVTHESVKAAVVPAVQNDPTLANALNVEHPLQSGVTWGGGAGFLLGVAVVWHEIGSGNPDPTNLGAGLGVILAGLFTLYRRWANTPPLFAKWFKKGT